MMFISNKPESKVSLTVSDRLSLAVSVKGNTAVHEFNALDTYSIVKEYIDNNKVAKLNGQIVADSKYLHELNQTLQERNFEIENIYQTVIVTGKH